MTHFPRILIVSPHPQIYGALQQLAAAAECRFDWAPNPSRLDELLSSGSDFDAAVLDTSSAPDAREIELAEQMRRSLGCGFVVISDHVQHAAAANGLSHCHDVYLRKPVRPTELIAAAKQICAYSGRTSIEDVPTRDPDVAKRAALRTIEGFGGLSDGVLDRIGLATTIARMPAEAIVLRENSRPTHLHAVLEGQVALITTTERDSTVTEIIGPGFPFILAAVLADTPYIQAAMTLVPSKVIRIETLRLRTEIGRDPRLLAEIIGSLSRHDRMLVRQLAELKLRSAAQRLGCFLLRLAEQQENATGITLPCSKAVLAAHLGMAPEHLSRAFVTLRSCGVTTRGPFVALGDPQTLARFARPNQKYRG